MAAMLPRQRARGNTVDPRDAGRVRMVDGSILSPF